MLPLVQNNKGNLFVLHWHITAANNTENRIYAIVFKLIYLSSPTAHLTAPGIKIGLNYKKLQSSLSKVLQKLNTDLVMTTPFWWGYNAGMVGSDAKRPWDMEVSEHWHRMGNSNGFGNDERDKPQPHHRGEAFPRITHAFVLSWHKREDPWDGNCFIIRLTPHSFYSQSCSAKSSSEHGRSF